jgi:DNA repair protein RadC
MPTIPLVRLRVVKEATVRFTTSITTPVIAEKIARDLIGEADRESMIALYLNTKNKPVCVQTVALGSINHVSISASDVFRTALLTGTPSLLVVHCHPSDDPEPSPEDLAWTRNLVQAGKILDIEVVDHLIIGTDTCVSLRSSYSNLWAAH